MKKLKSWSISFLLFTLVMNIGLVSLSVGAKTPKVLSYNKDGKFKIMQIADIQEAYPYAERMKQDIMNYLEYEKPDLVVLTGDNLAQSATVAQTEEMLRAMVEPFDTLQIPWMMTFGNHDWEVGMSEKAMIEYVQTISPSFIGELGDESIQDPHPLDMKYKDGRYGQGSYEIKGKDGATKNVVYLLDSGTYTEGGKPYGYGSITPKQVEWYNTKSLYYKEQNQGQPIPSLMFFHIPTNQWNEAFDAGDAQGYRREDAYIQSHESGIVEQALQNQDVKAMFVGHDHVNDYVADYKGIKLGYGGAPTYDSYNNDQTRGVRVIVLDEDDPAVFQTYMRRKKEMPEVGATSIYQVSKQQEKAPLLPTFAVPSTISATPLQYVDFENGAKNNMDGTELESGNIEYVEGISGKAAKYQGDSYVSLGNISYDPQKSFTFSFWSKRQAGGDAPFISNKNWDSGSNPGFALAVQNSIYPWINFRDRDKVKSRLDYKINAGMVADNAWHHIGFVVDRGEKNVNLFVDGEKVFTGAIDQFADLSFDSGLETVIGNDGRKNKYNPHFVGLMDEVKFFEQTISDEDMKILSNEFERPIETTFQHIHFPSRYVTVNKKKITALEPIVAPYDAADRLLWEVIGGAENMSIDMISPNTKTANVVFNESKSAAIAVRSENNPAVSSLMRLIARDEPSEINFLEMQKYYLAQEELKLKALTDVDQTVFGTVKWEVDSNMYSPNIASIYQNEASFYFDQIGTYSVKAVAQEGEVYKDHSLVIIPNIRKLMGLFDEFKKLESQLTPEMTVQKKAEIQQVSSIVNTYRTKEATYALNTLSVETVTNLEATMLELLTATNTGGTQNTITNASMSTQAGQLPQTGEKQQMRLIAWILVLASATTLVVTRYRKYH